MKKPIIEFKDYGFQYNAQAEPTLYHIDLTIYEGEKILIIGPSGSGKSTLGNCINGLIPFSYKGEITGTLIIDGKEAKTQSLFELSKSVGTVLQDPDGQFIGLTAGEDIAFSLENDCVPVDEMHELTSEAAGLVGMKDYLDTAPHALSGGQKQRVSLAGVIVDRVKILLFDEPLANLDPDTGKQAIALIDRIQKETDTTVIIIEHRLEDVLYREVDRIVLICDGRIVADMKPNQLLSGKELIEHGIREPLYLSALRYAGVNLSPEKYPAYIDKLRLTGEDSEKVNKWFLENNIAPLQSKEKKLLEVRNLTFSYEEGVTVLEDVSFEVRAGELLAIVGSNGAGKSTLSKLICGFEIPDRGEIIFNGKNLAGETIAERARHIGYVMQNPNQMISKSMIYDEVALGLRNSDMTEEQIRERVEETLKICGLYPFRNWPISALSFGQKKRVTIASILVIKPEVIILDEPTAGQDFRHYTEIMGFLEHLNRCGFTVIMITHDMHLMLEYAPRALVFSKKKLIADKSSAKILTDVELTVRASLKETSLFALANRCKIEKGTEFVQRFIDHDREVRLNEQQ